MYPSFPKLVHRQLGNEAYRAIKASKAIKAKQLRRRGGFGFFAEPPSRSRRRTFG